MAGPSRRLNRYHFPYCTMHTNSAALYSVVMIYAQSPLGLLTISPTTRCPAHAHQGRTPAQARHPAKDARHMVILIFYRTCKLRSMHKHSIIYYKSYSVRLLYLVHSSVRIADFLCLSACSVK
ncbi:Pyridoxamine 5'-phosphate oxidase family protein ustO [Fusarium oxysporum f. sp. albedinis]|nr:Pyridoxamine 5'-phosphate oxidase family protein ustO [Fusarium oxysporum f. sp. albedinis]